MSIRHAHSLRLIWQIAAIEASQQNASLIEPTHFFLGLCKAVDLDLPKVAVTLDPHDDTLLEELLREVRRLKNVFVVEKLDAKPVRRRIRAKLHRTLVARSPGSKGFHRSNAAKDIFREAETLAKLTESAVFPIHLLYALLLAEDTCRDQVLAEFGIDGKKLNQACKQEALAFRSTPQKNNWN